MLKYEFQESKINDYLNDKKFILGRNVGLNGSFNCMYASSSSKSIINKELKRGLPLYEYLNTDTPCRPYIDYDFKDETLLIACMNEFKTKRTEIKKILLNQLLTVYIQSLNDLGCMINHDNVLILDGSRIIKHKNKDLYKISFHLTTTNNDFIFKSQGHIKKFLIPRIDYNFLNLFNIHSNKNGVDKRVYGKTQKFRTIHSYKNDLDTECLTPINKNLEVLNVKNPIDYLICNIPKKPFFINRIDDNIQETKNQKTPHIQAIGGSTGTLETKTENKNEYFIIHKITEILRQHIKSAVYKYSNTYNDTLYYYFSYDSNINKCSNDKEHERSTRNNNILKVHIYNGVVFVGCFGSSCSKRIKKIGVLLPISPMYDSGLQVNTRFLMESDKVQSEMDAFINDDFKRVLCVRSCYGTGKTHMMNYTIPNIINNIETKYMRPVRICMISTRQSFARSISNTGLKTLNLINYLDVDYKKIDNYNKINRIIISVESIHKITDGDFKYYDIVILDESACICRQIFSETVKMDKLLNYNKLKMLIKYSKKTFILDADLSTPSLCLSDEFKENQITKINNTYEQKTKIYNFTNNKQDFKEKIKKSLMDGRNIFIVCLSAGESNEYEKEINEYMKWTTDDKLLNINGQTDDNKKEMLKNVVKFWSKYRCVITTSTTGAGIDFNKEDYFNDVYGVIIVKSAPPAEFLQIMNRVRKHSNNEINILCENVSMDTEKGFIYTFDNVQNNIKDIENVLIKSVINYATMNEQGEYINTKLSTIDDDYKSYNTLRTYYEMNNEYNKRRHNYLLILKLMLEGRGHIVNVNKEDVKNKKTKSTTPETYAELKTNIYTGDDIKKIVGKKKQTKQEKIIIKKIEISNKYNVSIDRRDTTNEEFFKTDKNTDHILKNIINVHMTNEYAEEKINTCHINQDLKDFKNEILNDLYKQVITKLKYDYTTEHKVNLEDYNHYINELKLTKSQKAVLQSRGELKNNVEVLKLILRRYGLVITRNTKREQKGDKYIRVPTHYTIKPDVKTYSLLKNRLLKLTTKENLFNVKLTDLLKNDEYNKFIEYTKPKKLF